MLASGNGDSRRCVNNLLLLTRGEVPYERLKGMDPELIDRPSGQALSALAADVDWLIETYEPRADVQLLDLRSISAMRGDFMLNVNILKK